MTYDNSYEVYGGINFMNFQAGQDLPKRMNLGGAEVLGTYWLTRPASARRRADYRGEAGTTPVLPNPYYNRATGLHEHGTGRRAVPRTQEQYAALNYHAYGGVAHGTFRPRIEATIPPQYDRSDRPVHEPDKPMAALGGSMDFNRSKKLAVRLSPDLILEHFGTETREFFSISGGVVYRFGKK